jgi:hypothetical protein
VIDGLRGCRPRLAVDRRRADEPRVKRVDARGVDNDLACAFVFLVKPAGCTTTAMTPPSSSSSSSSAPSRRRRSFPVIFRPTVHRRQGARVGNCASAEQRPRNKSSDEEKARPWRLRPSSEARQVQPAARLGLHVQAGVRRDVRAASDANGGRPLDAELRGAEEPICTHVSPRVHCNRCACAVDEKPINYRGMHGEHVRHNEEQTNSKCMDVQVSLQLIDVSANGTFAAELLRLSTIGCHDTTVRATSIKEPCPS